MRIFLVGGAVRDKLLGLEPKDRDYLVVGASPEEMKALGFKQVGADFPVFLHPKTGEEHALARQERKTAWGRKGFEVDCSPEVSLEDDLLRRDLTINAIALDESDGTLHDPYGGRADLAAGVLRHVSEAFSEDPLRVLRVCRFASKYGFAPAPETAELCRQLGSSERMREVSPERVFSELRRICEARPDFRAAAVRMVVDFGVAASCFPQIEAGLSAAADRSDLAGLAPEHFMSVCFGALDSEQAKAQAAAMKFSGDWADAASRPRKIVESLLADPSATPESRLADCLERVGLAKLRPEALAQTVAVAKIFASEPSASAWIDAAASAAPGCAALSVAEIAKASKDPKSAVRAAREAWLRDFLSASDAPLPDWPSRASFRPKP